MSGILHVENNDLDAVLGDGSKPVLVDFYAEWCGPCKAMAPALDDVAGEMADSLIVAKVDIDKNQQLAVTHKVGSVPTLMIFVEKKQAAMHVGAMGKSQLRDWVTQTTGSPTT
ncbi:MAG: thioredoxin [Phycisphaerae bacterium]